MPRHARPSVWEYYTADKAPQGARSAYIALVAGTAFAALASLACRAWGLA